MEANDSCREPCTTSLLKNNLYQSSPESLFNFRRNYLASPSLILNLAPLPIKAENEQKEVQLNLPSISKASQFQATTTN